MMTSAETWNVEHACERFGIPVPPEVVEARTLLAAAQQVLSQARGETAPDLANATAKNIGALIDAAADNADQQPARIAAAQAAVAELSGRETHAWKLARHGLITAMREPFDTAADDLLASASRLAPVMQDRDSLQARAWSVDMHRVVMHNLADAFQAYTDAAGRLAALARAREALDTGEPRNDLGIGQSGHGMPYAKAARFAHFTSRDAAMKVSTIGTDIYEPRWWMALAHLPGVTLRWQHDHERIPFTALAVSA